jgi:hypothetical protein
LLPLPELAYHYLQTSPPPPELATSFHATAPPDLPACVPAHPLDLHTSTLTRPPDLQTSTDLFHEHNQVGREEKPRHSDGEQITGISRMVVRVDDE